METKTETRVEHIILKHLTGSKTGQTDRLELGDSIEITIGRNPSSRIVFDPEKDDLVSGNHARLIWEAADPEVFTLTDLGSRNGTFVNNQRVTSPVRLRLGDQIQFGPDGPKMEFDCDPRPEGLIKATRMASVGSAALSAAQVMRPTRTSNEINGSSSAENGILQSFSDSFTNGAGANLNGGSSDEISKAHSPGRTTVWNMVTNAQRQTQRQMLYGIAAVALVAGLLAWKFWPKTPILNPGCDAKCVAGKFGTTTVKLNVTWKLISPTGGLVYHQYRRNLKPNGKDPLLPGGGPFIPLYVKLNDGTIEPFLSYDGNSSSDAIGGSHIGSGFFVSSNGFILTNKHVAATWEHPYQFPSRANMGVVFAADKKTPLGVLKQAPDDWIPAKTRQEFGFFKGANDKLEVSLPGSVAPIRAELTRVSPRHDVAMIKLETPEAAPSVEINDNYDSIKEGEAITILGYPGVTAPIYGFVRSADDPSRREQTVIPHVTVTPGSIGAILRNTEGKDMAISRLGDVYQLTANATGAGNSGGPVFDDQGRVIGIFFAGRSYGGASVTYAVPIRYGKEMLSLR